MKIVQEKFDFEKFKKEALEQSSESFPLELFFIILEKVFKFNGFIAGGAAIYFYNNQNKFNFRNFIEKFNPRTFSTLFGNNTSIRLIDEIDIDIFFKSQIDLENFISFLKDLEISLPNKIKLYSNSFAAISFYINNFKFQIIKYPSQNFEELFKTFDIINSMVAFDQNNFYYHENWKDLKEIEITKITKRTLQRASKYIHTKGFVGISKNSKKIIFDTLFSLTTSKRETHRILMDLSCFEFNNELSPADLILLSALAPVTGGYGDLRNDFLKKLIKEQTVL